MPRELTLDPAEDTTWSFDIEQGQAACRTLVAAYANNPEDVDWSDVQQALDHALNAFGLPQDYPEQVYRKDDEEA